MKLLPLEKRILLSRFMTRSGDQAWDFALPLALVSLLPNRLGLVATVYLISKIISIILQPWVARIIDRSARLKTVTLATSLQVSGVAIVTLLLSKVASEVSAMTLSPLFWTSIGVIIIGNVASNLGSAVMDIAVGSDWVPKMISTDRFTNFNSRLRQLDLTTEIASPMITGAILLLNSNSNPLAGFYWIAAWNMVSFLPEILLLRSVFHAEPKLQQSIVVQNENASKNILARLFEGWGEFRKQKCMPAMVAYAFLWLSALSPHGVLLTAFLKGSWQMQETTLGIFRGLGAVFGLFATILFPIVTKRLGLLKSTRTFVVFQALTVTAALLFFVVPLGNGMLFLAFVLLSRIGLYGFSLGEIEIRQRMIPEGARGAVNGVASSLTGLATVGLFALGSIFSTPDRFNLLVAISAVAVFCSALVYSVWAGKNFIQGQIK